MKKPFPGIVWLGLFGLGVYAWSKWFEASRAFFAAPDGDTGLALALATGVLVLLMGALAYDVYVQEKHKGTLLHPVRLFEWIYRRQYGESGERS